MNPCHVAERRQEVVESKLQVALAARTDVAWPTDNKRNADAAFVGAALQPAKLAVVVEVFRVGASLFVRAVVAGEDHHRVVCQSTFFQELHNLAHLCVKARNHGRELGMPFLCGIVARGFVAAVCTFGQ